MTNLLLLSLLSMIWIMSSNSYSHSILTGKNKLFKSLLGFNVALASIITQQPSESFADLAPSPWSDKIEYEVLKEAPGSASFPKAGDLVAIRFRAKFKDIVFDDVFKTADPYYYRCGVGSVVQGLDETVLHMKEGERVHARFGGDLAFGSKGLPSAPGRPRIPPNAILDYEVKTVSLIDDLFFNFYQY